MKKNHAEKESKNIIRAQRLMKIHEGFPLIYIQTQIVFTSLGCEADIHHQYLISNRSFSFHPHAMKMIRSHQHYFVIIVTSNHPP